MFSGYSRWTPAGEKQAISFFSFHHRSQHNIHHVSLPPYLLLFSGHKQSDSLFSPPDPYTKLLPGGCCSRNEVQAFDPAPDHWLKGCHFSFRPLSIPRQLFISEPGRHTFYHIHTSFVMWPAHSALSPATVPGNWLLCEHKYLNSNTIAVKQTANKAWHWLCWNWIDVNVCFSAQVKVSHNMMAASTYMKSAKTHITYQCWAKVKFTVKDKKNMLNHLHEGKRGQI